MFSKLIGQDKIKHFFTRVIQSEKIPHSYLFSGPKGTGKTAAALEFAQILTCHNTEERPCGRCDSCFKYAKMEHPDVMIYFPVSGSPKVEDIQQMRIDLFDNPYRQAGLFKNATLRIEIAREIKKRLNLKSYLGHRRAIIILGCETMTVETANALLKILEEPNEDVFFILTTSVLEDVLPTIKSRCQLLRMSYLTPECISKALQDREGVSTEKAKRLSALADGSYSKSLEYLNEDFDRNRKICFKILEYCSIKPDEEIIALSGELAQKENAKNIELIFATMLVILRHHYRSLIVTKYFENHDNSVFALPFSFPDCNSKNLEFAIGEIEKSVDLLNKNVYLNLILVVLLFRLKAAFRDE